MNTTNLVLLALFVVIIALAYLIWSRRAAHADRTSDWPFRMRNRVLSPSAWKSEAIDSS